MPALPLAQPGVEQPVGDVVERRRAASQMELLEDETDAAGAQRRQVRVAEPGHVVAVDPHPPGGRPVERTDDVQHRGLARAGRPDDGGELAALDMERDAGERGDPTRIDLRDVSQLDHLGIPTTVPGRDAVAGDLDLAVGEQPGLDRDVRRRAALDDLDTEPALLQGQQRGDRHRQHVLALVDGERHVDRGQRERCRQLLRLLAR